MTADVHVTAQHFVLAVPDVRETARWWIDVMGFEIWADPPGWVFLRRGACSLMLGECPDALPPSDLGDHQYFAYVVLDDLDAFHAEIAARGADVRPPQDRPWGMREMPVATPDGHRIMFGQDLG